MQIYVVGDGSIAGRLGRVKTHDERDLAYPARAVLDRLAPRKAVKTREWNTTGLPLDQGETPECVGFSSRGWLTSGPVVNTGGPSADDIYVKARQISHIPANVEGADPRGAMKYLQQVGAVVAYVWAWDVDTMAEWVLTQSPVLFGCDWYTSFDHKTKADQTCRLVAGAVNRGGHEFEVCGVDLPGKRFRVVNTWGTIYGDLGKVWFPFDTIAGLFKDGADCVTPTEHLLPPVSA